ncbi:hypothetical protein FF38_07094 [Lucilia cuprina]|uniref:Uncharacterized protein n=1 Tax=Lucilia cuprina TaxID=7375 RepID=A0A0L0BUI8_LUCCU|nr:hypothetical protein CVS40_6420 [Lucilia cuprina]KNC23696.1 hypothetical protein FF38_07094 [Lucilia cuprina]
MYSSVKREIPEFIQKYMVFCDCFIDIKKEKTCWVLTKNLKFMEFWQKQLVASIDLSASCLSKIAKDLQQYKGPKGKWYENSSNLLPQMTENEQNRISIGKYMFHAVNIYKIYVIIQCWDKCIVLMRLPDFKGFEIKAEYEDVHSYSIVHGSIKFCPVIEFKFQNKPSMKTDFQEQLATREEHDLESKKFELRQLLERIRSAKTELQLHKSITAHSFHKVQNNQTLGQSFLRTIKIEEKQILNRCGDIWKRFTAHDDLVIGVPLVNQCAAPNLTIIRNLIPVLQTNQSPEHSIQLQYRMFQLKLKFDQLDAFETFLESEDEQLQENVWSSKGDLQILPESFVVLLIKLKISQIISLKQCPLFINYEVVRHLNLTPDPTKSTFTMSLQLFLQNLDFHKLLFEERSQCELNFLPPTLHQDFLTIAMTSQEINLKITFSNIKDLEIFEHFLKENLNFLKPSSSLDCHSNNFNFPIVFYNKNPSSLWYGSLIMRLNEISENDSDQCLTKWKLYCQSYDKTLLLVKTFLNDLLSVKCNIISIANCDRDKNAAKCVLEFENALRQELEKIQDIVRNAKNIKTPQDYLSSVENLCQLQMNSDIIAIDVMENKINM